MDSKAIGANLRKLREEKRQTKRQVAKATGCSYSSICSYEYGERVPSDEVKIRLAQHFGVSVSSIFYSDN